MADETQVALPVSEETMDAMAQEAIRQVFLTMLQSEVELTKTEQRVNDDSGEIDSPLDTDGPMIVGAVGFLGSFNGVIYLYFDRVTAKKMTARLLGFEEGDPDADDDEVIRDSLGEMTNMIVGMFKNQICDYGFNCRLTVPTILQGTSFRIDTTTEVVRRMYHFNTEWEPIAAELFIKLGE